MGVNSTWKWILCYYKIISYENIENNGRNKFNRGTMGQN